MLHQLLPFHTFTKISLALSILLLHLQRLLYKEAFAQPFISETLKQRSWLNFLLYILHLMIKLHATRNTSNIAEHQCTCLLVPLFCLTRSSWNSLLGAGPTPGLSLPVLLVMGNKGCYWTRGRRVGSSTGSSRHYQPRATAKLQQKIHLLQVYKSRSRSCVCWNLLFKDQRGASEKGKRVVKMLWSSSQKASSYMQVYLCLCNPICPSPLPEAALEIPSSWALEIAAWDVLFKMVFFSQ